MARPPGSFKIANQRRSFELAPNDPWPLSSNRRIRGILDSIHSDLRNGGTCRVRQILKSPSELYRLELERPDVSYERITILDSNELEQLLEELPEQTVRDSFRFSA